MGSKGSQTTTVNQNQNQSWSPPDDVAARYRALLDQIGSVGQTPFQSYSGPIVAGFSPDQMAAFQGVRNAQGVASPYLQQAQDYALISGAPSYKNVESYMSPYMQSVIDATRRNFSEDNARQQQQVIGNAAMQGALGGDRVGVAQAELARQQRLSQDPVIANLYNQGYQSALSTAGADASRAGNAASLFAGLGQTAQQAALTDASALMSTGQLQQQLQQAQYNVPYQQFLEQRAYPFQTAQWLASLTSGLGSQLGGQSSSTGTNTTTQPGPNSTSGWLGAGLGALGFAGQMGWLAPLAALSDRRAKEDVEQVGELFDGQPVYRYRYIGEPQTQIGLMAQDVERDVPDAVGRAGMFKTVDYDMATEPAARKRHFAEGGGVAMPYARPDGVGGVPLLPMMTHEFRAPSPMQMTMPNRRESGDGVSAKDMVGSALDIAKSIRRDSGPLNLNPTGGSWGAGSIGDTFMPAAGLGSLGGMYAGGLASGGRVAGGIYMPRGYAGGGSPSSFSDRWGPFQVYGGGDGAASLSAAKAIVGLQQVDPAAMQAWREDFNNPALIADRSIDEPTPSIVPQTAGFDRPVMASAGTGSVVPMRYAPPQDDRPVMTDVSAQSRQGAAEREGASPWLSLMAAGLGMMASRSPYLGQAVGEGGLMGLQNYAQQKAAIDKARREDAALALQQRRADLEAKRLAEAADKAGKELALRTRQVESEIEGRRSTGDIKEYEYAKAQGYEGSFADFMQRKKAATGSYGLQPIWGKDKDGNPVILQLSNTGEFGQPKLPPNVTVGKDPVKLDVGDAFVLLDPVTRSVIGRVPKNIREKEKEEEIGRSEGKTIAGAPKAAAAMRDLESQWALVDKTIDKALQDIDWTTTGFVGSASSAIPGTPAYNLARTLETIKANIGFDKLQSMRDNSPTGGALGQVSEFENRLLQAVRGSMEQGQSPAQIKSNMEQIKRDLRALRQERKRAFEQTYGTGQPAASPSQRPATVPAGSKYSPSRGQWRDSQGNLYNAAGEPVQ